jgi:hypothetical protein
MATSRLKGWIDWYRFARTTLVYGHAEAAAYANLRYVEEMNRSTLSRRATARG